jgi:phospholipid transport system substrate-binding protein
VRTLSRRVAVACTVVVFLLDACPGAEAGPPTETLRDFFAEAGKILASTENQPDERWFAARRLASGLFEFEEAAQVALGHNWYVRTPAEQDEFVRLFREVILRSYVSQLAAVGSTRAGLGVDYLDESSDRDTAIVRTRLVSGDRIGLILDYQMVHRGQGWRVRDVLKGGVSVVANYRAQIHRFIRRSSYAELVMRMSVILAEAPAGSVASDVRLPAPGRMPILSGPAALDARPAFGASRVPSEKLQGP